MPPDNYPDTEGWPVVQKFFGLPDEFFRDEFKTHLLGKELSNQSIHVFVGATLPGGIRVREVEIRPQFLCDSLMLGKFLAIVGRDGMNMSGERLKQGNHRVRHDGSLLAGHMGNESEARATLIDGK